MLECQPLSNVKVPNGLKPNGIPRLALVEGQPRRDQRDLAGEVLHERTIGPFLVSEVLYSSGLALPKHAHRQAYVTIVIEGTFRERYAGGAITCRPGSLRFLPAGEVHENEFESEVRCLHIRTDQAALDGLDRRSPFPKKPAEINGLAGAWLANRLCVEFSRDDNASGIAIEGLILEILAEAARSNGKAAPVRVPRWLKQATDIVESRFLERLSLPEIASEVGVHYVHLSREFRRYNRCTIGDLIRRRRVQHASHLLAHSRTSLAEIALICGFSDQSHLSFMFKRYMGISPLKFRTLAGPDPRSSAGESA